ncbi:MAG TPA: bifunctional [glutamate--ammonia ligase]-adenylyl-L-tyrosine phosphorylase/[glutamate--ammonia-ligase] adenylyltransferase [Thiotrichales bacterium]|nr:bifunctional [glutamate--ammonia ligase]-adenylyl-L-tyrosine phosphorylase/[glutamate--ammonia-ligase] adenylyltransferase [Thiotrichales bacterium]
MARKNNKPARPVPCPDLPAALREAAATRWRAWETALAEIPARVGRDPALARVQCRLFGISEFVAATCIRAPGLVEDLLESGDLLADSAPGEIGTRVRARIASCADEAALRRDLRRLRSREMLRIAWRDLAGWARLEETLRELSELADACIEGALERLTAWQAAASPQPRLADGRRPAPLVVLAMGKLGARELNFSSDVDLIFAYPDARPGRRGAPGPEDWFTRLGQSLIQVLSEVDHDGFVFRVDMRLRPYGSAGALVCSYSALEEYYQSQGREWERYAMIKARPLGGDKRARAGLMELLRPFVFRRYLDFQAFEALRELKRQIRREVARREQQDNLKLGPGGIREIEFIVQAFQLVHGGRDPALRTPAVLDLLPLLAGRGLLPAHAVEELARAYRFLRRAENQLQAQADAQVHRLPQDEAGRAALALSMGFPGWKAFVKVLDGHRRRVEAHFGQVFDSPQQTGREDVDQPLRPLWLGQCDDEEARRLLEAAGYADPAAALSAIEQLRTGTAPRYLGEQGRQRFDALVPMVIAAAARQPDAATVLARLVRVLEQIAGRTTYLALLQEHPLVLSQLVRLTGASAWIADQIARFPMLLDQLLDPRTLYTHPGRETLRTELDQRLADVPEDDLEQQMDRLRQFRHAMVLRIAAADIAGAAEVDRVSEELTQVAETVLERVLSIAWADLVRRHGEPRCGRGRRARSVRFAIIGYGKLGGRELGYGSDLDLVFLHDSAGEGRTSGRRGVDNAVFFARLGQRIIHMLETFTAAGRLYEVDVRLRPSGNSGLLVSSLEAFEDYQLNEAWTWEHQALVRARPVAGDAAVGQGFGAIRARALAARARDPQVRAEVCEMRERMRRELNPRGPGFHLKHGRGGIVDIEFMVQYLVLRHSRAHPVLLERTDSVGLLRLLSREALLKSAWAQALIEAYQRYRERLHRLTLAEASPVVEDPALDSPRRQVAEIWRQLMAPAGPD